MNLPQQRSPIRWLTLQGPTAQGWGLRLGLPIALQAANPLHHLHCLPGSTTVASWSGQALNPAILLLGGRLNH